MRFSRLFSSIAIVTLAAFSSARAEIDADGFEHVPLIVHNDVDVTLLLRPVANPADRTFIGFLINNKTGRFPQLGSNANYRIDEAQIIDRATQTQLSTTGILSGNPYDLLYRDVMKINTPRPELPLGLLRRLDSTSSRALSSLGIPKKGSAGLTIKARVHLDLAFDGKFVSTPQEGVPIQFDWMPPDEEGVTSMRARLRELLLDGDPGARHLPALMTLLDHPDIGSTMTTTDLVQGLSVWEQSGRHILKYLDQHRKPGEGLLDYALDVIARRDHLRMLVLQESTSLHDVRLIEPLKAWAVEGEGRSGWGREGALELLSRQIDLAPDRESLTAELGKAWLARSPHVAKKSLATDDRWRWEYEARLLAMTRDPNLVSVFVPYLSRTELVVDVRELSIPTNGISIRACDIAYNTILDLLDREGERFEITRGWGGPVLIAETEYKRRDELIRQLKAELEN